MGLLFPYRDEEHLWMTYVAEYKGVDGDSRIRQNRVPATPIDDDIQKSYFQKASEPNNGFDGLVWYIQNENQRRWRLDRSGKNAVYYADTSTELIFHVSTKFNHDDMNVKSMQL